MKIAIGSDHGGFGLKTKLAEHFKARGYDVFDEGTYDTQSCDYPVFAKRVAKKTASGESDFGVLVCTSGMGMTIAANKVKGARAAFVRTEYDAEMTRRHNDANVVCFGEAVVSFEEAARLAELFFHTAFDGGRHTRRVGMLEE